MRWSDRRKEKPSHHPHPSSTHFPPSPTPFRKYWRTPVATSQKFGPLLRRTFAPAAILCYSYAKLNFSELLRTLSRGSQKFGPKVRRTCLPRSAEVWNPFSQEGLRGFAICIASGFFLNVFLNVASKATIHVLLLQSPCPLQEATPTIYQKNQARTLYTVKEKKTSSAHSLIF